jgi:signal transduction histidine kinase/integral membrane sensor domain MASE1
VGVAYYVGARIGFALKFPPVTPSVLWPPNAILTATLLLAPTRRWWIYLLAAFPAHLLVQAQAVRPMPLILALFATNCSEALVAAGGVRWLSDASARFDTLRRVGVFVLAAVLVAPFVSSFADAAAVAALRAEPYWLVWRTRFFSNILTELTLVPAIVMVVTAGPAWIRGASQRRAVEGGLLAVGLVAVGFVVFAGPTEGPLAIPGSPRTSLALLLPFLLWAAVRFGPGGASLSLLTTALLAIWAGTQGHGPFTTVRPAEGVLALQIFLTAVGIPLLCLAGVIEERRRAEEALGERLRFEELLSRLSGAFVHLPSHEMDRAIETWLGRLGEFLGLDRLIFLRLSDDEWLPGAYSWAGQGFEPVRPVIVRRDFPWAAERLLHEQTVVFTRPDELPDDAARDRDSLRRHKITSGLILPLVAGGRVLGGLAFVAVAAPRAWPQELVQRLQLVAGVFANALARKETEDALRASEGMKSAILASLTSSVAVLDREGRIIAVNQRWARFGREDGATSDVGVGVNYLEVCRQAALQGSASAGELLAGIEAVLARSRPGFTLEYAFAAPGAERWFTTSVVPLRRPAGGAVISRTDITERKRAERDVQQMRQELAHFSRVSTMGELTASLAHELTQPLMGILANAQAARRFLDATPPDLGEMRDILSDIIEDDKRAGEVIQRLRDLLRKGETQRALLDLNTLIRDVASLVSSDAVIRNVSVILDLDPDPAMVSGDRVQLQQVVLNLLVNGMEAMAECEGARTLVVQTEKIEARTVGVSVQDAGTGLPEGAQDKVFEPFYTTKPAGMGMGLSIARSIIEAHGGRIWAVNNPGGGATFRFTLPVSAGRSPD